LSLKDFSEKPVSGALTKTSAFSAESDCFDYYNYS